LRNSWIANLRNCGVEINVSSKLHLCSTVDHHDSWAETTILQNALSHKTELQDSIRETTALVDLLISFHVLSIQEANEVKSKQKPVDQSELIIDYLLKKSWIEVVKFVSAVIRISYQPDVAVCILEKAGSMNTDFLLL
jgi:hypothetical protein